MLLVIKSLVAAGKNARSALLPPVYTKEIGFPLKFYNKLLPAAGEEEKPNQRPSHQIFLWAGQPSQTALEKLAGAWPGVLSAFLLHAYFVIQCRTRIRVPMAVSARSATNICRGSCRLPHRIPMDKRPVTMTCLCLCQCKIFPPFQIVSRLIFFTPSLTTRLIQKICANIVKFKSFLKNFY